MPTHRSKLGAVRAYGLAVTVFMSAFLQGYDAGVGGGILTFASFQSSFGYSKQQKTQVTALSVGLQNLGAFASCPFVYWISDRYGRRPAIIASLVVLLVGTVIQTINTGNLAVWYIARVIGGFGLGGCTAITPIYSAEMAPREIRGRLGSMYQMMYTIGIFTAYWVNYGVQKHIVNDSNSQWQIPISLEIVWASIMLVGILFLSETVRWYLKRGRDDEAWGALVWVRGDAGAATVDEFEQIKQGHALENASRAGLSVKELLEPVNRKRLSLGILLFMFQQGSGSGALATYGPQFFTLVVGAGSASLLLTGFFGAVKVVACAIFIIFVAERFGRKPLLVFGSLGMFTCMLPIALILKFRPPPGGVVTAAGGAEIALLFLNIGIYNWSWGPVTWVLVPELFPTRYRSLGVSISVSMHWAFSVCFSLAVPYMIQNIGWGTFLFFAIFDLVNATGSWLLVQETKGRLLEDLDHDFKLDAVGENGLAREEAAFVTEVDSEEDIKHGKPSMRTRVVS